MLWFVVGGRCGSMITGICKFAFTEGAENDDELDCLFLLVGLNGALLARLPD